MEFHEDSSKSKNIKNTSKSKKKISRIKKRKWNGIVSKQPKFTVTPCVIGESLQSSSAKKISYTVDQSNSEGLVDNIEDFFLFLHFNVLTNICRELIACPDCAANVVVIDQHLKRMGFAHCILIKCSICDWMKPFYTSPKTSYNPESNFKDRKTFDVNARNVIGFKS